MAGNFDLGNYIQVADRLDLFYAKYPDGRVSSAPPVVVVMENGQSFVQVTTTVWRSPDDPTPCQASAWELFPGKTTFTKDSEMMNAETSAVGRALWALGIEAKKGAASQEDVRNARASQEAPPPAPALSPEEQAHEDHVQAVLNQAKDLKMRDNGGTGQYWKGIVDEAGESEDAKAGSAKAISSWVRSDVAYAEELLTRMAKELKAARNQPPAEVHNEPPPPAPEKKPRKRATPGSAVEEATNVVKGAFPGAEEVAE
jgi:hypothetical protein